MTPEQFVYWLQGYAELTDCAELTTKQWDMVKSYLAIVLENKPSPVSIPWSVDVGDGLLYGDWSIKNRLRSRTPNPEDTMAY